MEALDVIGESLWYGILATPLIAYLIVRSAGISSLRRKLLVGVFITLILAFIFFCVSFAIFARNGLGPT